MAADDDADRADHSTSGSGEQRGRLSVHRRGAAPATLFTLAGRLDERFDPAGVEVPGAGAVLLDLGGVVEVTDGGAARWREFVDRLARAGEVGLVECPGPIITRLNDPAFAGPARPFSLRLPYRCDYCDEARPALFRFDRDADALASGRPPDRPCEVCGEATYFDEDPTYLAFAATCTPLELSQPAAALLARELGYEVAAPARSAEIRKEVRGRVTRIRVAGELGASFAAKKVADGLVGPILIDVSEVGAIDPAGAAAWRNFIQLATPGAEAIYLAGVSPLFLEKLARPDDLGTKGQVVSLAVPYPCHQCERTDTHVIDVAACHEDLALGQLPERRCPGCRHRGRPDVDAGLRTHLLQLFPATLSDDVRAILAGREPAPPKRRARRRRLVPLITAGGAVATAIAVAVVLLAGHRGGHKRVGVGALVARSRRHRPGWARGVTALSALCHWDALGLSCVGTSSYASSRADAREQADAAALEALAHEVAQRIPSRDWETLVGEAYTRTRRSRLAAFGRARAHPDRASYRRALFDLRQGRMLVADSFRKTGGSGVPLEPRDTYWEQYRDADGAGDRYLSLVEYQLPPAQVAYLADRYATPRKADGVTVVTLFPELAWRYPDVSTGAVVVRVDPRGPLAPLKLHRGDLLLSIDGRPVVDAGDFARAVAGELAALRRAGGTLRLRVQPRSGPASERRLAMPAPAQADAGPPPAR